MLKLSIVNYTLRTCAICVIIFFIFGFYISGAGFFRNEESVVRLIRDLFTGSGSHTYERKLKQFYNHIIPTDVSINVVNQKLIDYIPHCSNQQQKQDNPRSQNLVLYFIPRYDNRAAKVTKLNIELFLTSIPSDPCSSMGVFYLFNVVDGKNNPYFQQLPQLRQDMAYLDWQDPLLYEEHYHQIRALTVLDKSALARFGSVILLGVNVRGPLSERTDHKWVQTYRQILDKKHIGMVNPVGCGEIPLHQPVLHSYATAMSIQFVNRLIHEFTSHPIPPSMADKTFSTKINKLLGARADSLLVRSGLYPASIVQYLSNSSAPQRPSVCVLPSQSLNAAKSLATQVSPAWCAMDFTKQLFVRWGNDNVRDSMSRCPGLDAAMRRYLLTLSLRHPDTTASIEAHIGPIDAFETPYVGPLRDMFIQYAVEEKREFFRPPPAKGWESLLATSTAAVVAERVGEDVNRGVVSISAAAGTEDDVEQYSAQVVSAHRATTDITTPATTTTTSTTAAAEDKHLCFLVRTAWIHDAVSAEKQRSLPVDSFAEVNLFNFIRSLQKQTNPEWVAYLFLTDDKPFEQRLLQIIDRFKDPRLRYFHVDKAHRPTFSDVDGGYTATDFVLSQLLHEPSCEWLTVTNGDNIYGSEVVANVMAHTTAVSVRTASSSMSHSESAVQMLLAPLDSRNFATLDNFYSYGNKALYDHACRGLEARVSRNLLAYTSQPLPRLSRVDLAAIFLPRIPLRDANINFANFTDPVRYPCLGCQDGYLAESLIADLSWEYRRLPLDGLKSIVFHGPSPTLCIAAGNVWFDYPAAKKVGCYTRATVLALRVQDYQRPAAQRLYDWRHFDTSELSICLRQSLYAYSRTPEEDLYRGRLPSRLRRRPSSSSTALTTSLTQSAR